MYFFSETAGRFSTAERCCCFTWLEEDRKRRWPLVFAGGGVSVGMGVVKVTAVLSTTTSTSSVSSASDGGGVSVTDEVRYVDSSPWSV